MLWMQNFFSSVKMLLIVCFLLYPVFSAPHKSAARRNQEDVGSDSKSVLDRLDGNIPKVNNKCCYLMRVKLRLIMREARQGAFYTLSQFKNYANYAFRRNISLCYPRRYIFRENVIYNANFIVI